MATICVAACGGRTGMLDEEALDYGSNQPTGGAFPSAPQSQGGVGASHFSAGSSSGGSSAAAGATESVPVRECSKYCNSLFSSPCQIVSNPSACIAECSAQVSALDPKCQQAAYQAFGCLSAVASVPRNQCSELERSIAAACTPQVSQFEACLSTAPVELPRPDPPPSQGSCVGSASGTETSCLAQAECPNGRDYRIQCVQSGPNRSRCACTQPGGVVTPFELQEGVALACTDALAACSRETAPPPK